MRRVKAAFVGAALAAAILAVPTAQSRAPAAQSAEDRWLDAVDAWNAGRYPDALRGLTVLANGPAAPAFHDRIALLTGELFTTTEITTDGRNPRVSSTGDHVAYETGTGPAAVTRIVAVRPAIRQVAELPTTHVAFAPTGTRIAWLRAAPAGTSAAHDIVIRDLTTGAETVLPPDGLLKTTLTWSGSGDSLFFLGTSPNDSARSDVFVAREGLSPVRVTSSDGHKTGLLVDPSGTFVAYSETPVSPFGGRGGPAPASTAAVVMDVRNGATRRLADVVPGSTAMSADGSTLAWIGRAADGVPTLFVSPPLADTPTAIRAITSVERLIAPALSPDGQLVAYQLQTRVGSSTDWEIYVSDRSGTHRRITRDIQHDVLPRFLDDRSLLGIIGEPRHRRSYVYDLDTGTRTRVFHGNTIRTISPEYAWTSTPDGRFLVIQADRDGDVVSTARGLYLVDLTQTIPPAELSARLRTQTTHETGLRARMAEAYRPIADEVRATISRVSETRVYECHRAMAAFDSKFVGEPGNLKAIDYLTAAYRSFGYTPEAQWFTVKRNDALVKTANVVATLKGTAHPDVIYVVSSHFDSVVAGTGADDNTSGTCALLETARVLARTPIAATVVFASLTGEEAGLLGSEELVRLAAERKWRVAGALNNDMIGWAADGARIDNTIRYSSAGIRDLQHGAAFLFTDLVLFDARYYLGTDAATFNEVWGDVVGGIGSYPILANPNYHQASDLLETISFRQVAETARVTAASIMAMASSPARLTNVTASAKRASTDVTWTAAPETGISSYLVAFGPADNPHAERTTVKTPRATLPRLAPGARVAVKAINARGLESWDWAYAVVE